MIFVGPRLESKTFALQVPNSWKLKPEAEKRSNTSREVNAAADPRMDVAQARARKAAGRPRPIRTRPVLQPLAPPPCSPRLFESARTHNTPQPARVGRGGWAGLTVQFV